MRRPYKIAAIVIALIVAAGFYRYRWGVLGSVGIGPPQSACESVEALETYLNTGGDPSAYLWRTPLIMCAAEAGNEAVVAELIEAGADINAQKSPPRLPAMDATTGMTALYVAVEENYQGIVQLLVENSADINLCNCDINDSPLNLAVLANRADLLEFFLQSESDSYDFDLSLLDDAIGRGNLEALEVLTEYGFWFEDAYSEGLRKATGSGHLDVVKFLVENGIQNPESIYGAIAEDQPEILEFLIATGADINLVNEQGNTPLHIAAIWNRAEAVRLLVENGADLSKRNFDNQTPLEAARAEGNTEVMNVLMLEESRLSR